MCSHRRIRRFRSATIATTSKRTPRSGPGCRSSHTLATASISRRLRHVTASSGCPYPKPARVLTSTKATVPCRDAITSISRRPCRKPRASMRHPARVSRRDATASPHRPSSCALFMEENRSSRRAFPCHETPRLSLTARVATGSFSGCPRSAGRKLTNSVRTPQVAAVSAVIVAAGSLGHFHSPSL